LAPENRCNVLEEARNLHCAEGASLPSPPHQKGNCRDAEYKKERLAHIQISMAASIKSLVLTAVPARTLRASGRLTINFLLNEPVFFFRAAKRGSVRLKADQSVSIRLACPLSPSIAAEIRGWI
jgi:hypothetical protein